MKRLFKMIAVATALTFAWTACEEPAPEPGVNDGETPGNTEQPGENENQDGTVAEINAVLEGSTVKTVWAEGDAIMVYAVTEEGDVATKYILSAGEGTAEGKFVPSGKAASANATGYFATYPYNEDLSFAMHNTFSFTMEAEQTADVPVFAYAEDAANLTFSSPVGALKFSLSGKGGIAKLEISDKDSKNILNGNVTYNPKTTKFTVKNAAASKSVVTKVLAEKVELSDTPVDFVVEVPEGALATGGTLTLYDVNNSPIYSVELPAQTVAKGQVVAVATEPVVPVAQTVNLNSAQGYANTYVIKSVGKYKFEAVKGNSTEKVDAATAELTWETWCNNEAVVANSLVKNLTIENGYVLVETADDFHAGNALVSVKNAGGTIVWSWMLWFTEENIGNIEVDGVAIMDRNLGALTTAQDKPGLNYGLLWQWGRHVPILGLDGTHAETPTAMTSAPAVTDERLKLETAVETAPELAGKVGFTIDYVLANPTKFFYSGSRNWYEVSMDEAVSALWNTTKTMYDPCPAGYQVMTIATADVFLSDYEGISNDAANFGFTMNDVWYPLTGRWKYSGGSRLSDATMTYFWTCEQAFKDESNGYNCAYHRQVEGGAAKGSYESKGSAMTVRCEVVSAN